jgi:hypothetical protein
MEDVEIALLGVGFLHFVLGEMDELDLCCMIIDRGVHVFAIGGLFLYCMLMSVCVFVCIESALLSAILEHLDFALVFPFVIVFPPRDTFYELSLSTFSVTCCLCS